MKSSLRWLSSCVLPLCLQIVLTSSLLGQSTDPETSLRKAAAIGERTFFGTEASSQFGLATSSAGDVNGDGFADIIVGAPGYSSSTGRVHIFFGGIAPDNVPDVILTGEATATYFGWSVSGAGDVNGDGYGDVIVGAYGVTSNRGRAYIYYGGIHMDNVADVTLNGEASSAYFGYSVSGAGDANGDGFADVIVGAYGQSTYTGRAYVFYGGVTMNTTADVIMNGETTNTYFGYSVSNAGDVNGDGYTDVIVGAQQYSSATGRAYVFYGGASMNGTADITMTGEGTGNGFGQSVSTAGDVNGDGYGDVIVGAYAYSTSTGRAYIYFGGAVSNNIADVVLAGEAVNNRFGASVSDAGDINGDGYDDIVVGAYSYASYTGRAYMFFGGATMNTNWDVAPVGSAAGIDFGRCVSSAGDVNGDGYGDIIVSAPAFNTNTGEVVLFMNALIGEDIADLRLTGEATGNQFGFCVAGAGDVNGDGYPDIIVGAREALSSGRAYIYFGGPVMDDVVDVVLNGEAGGDGFGHAVASAGDVNGDGYADVIVGAPFAIAQTGKAYVFFGGASMNGVPDITMQGEALSSRFGWSVSSAGDIDRDGYVDVIVSAPNYLSDIGKVYLYAGGATMDSMAERSLTGSNAAQFGYSVAGAGDVNGDGYADFVVGERERAFVFRGGPISSVQNSLTFDDPLIANSFVVVSRAGDVNGDGYSDVIVGVYESLQAHIYFGGFTMDNIPDVILKGEAIHEGFGASVASAGDVNADGYADVVVGAYYGGGGLGRAYVYFGGKAMDNVLDVFMTGSKPGSDFPYFGYSVASAGDVNGDGYGDVIVGAFDYDGARGAAYVYRSSSPPVIPRIASIDDVPNDQGGVVNVRWIRSAYDARGISHVTGYRLERSEPPGVNGFAWMTVGTVPAAHNPQYSYTAPVPHDSMSGTKGTYFFRVTALTSNSEEYWRSNILSGYSVDNLPPAVVGGGTAASVNGNIVLHWNENLQDSDLWGYVVFRDTVSGVPLTGANKISLTEDTLYVDSSLAVGRIYYYKIAAIDVHGNIGLPSAELSQTVTTVEEQETIPEAIALEQNYPNPFNPTTVISYQLSVVSGADLRVFDVLGREVAVLVNEEKAAGRHSVTWDASALPSGAYYYRLQAGGEVRTRTMILLR